MIIDLNPDLPSVDPYAEPGHVIVVTAGKVSREWGRISAEVDGYRYPKAKDGRYNLGPVDVHVQNVTAGRWMVENGRGVTFEFYFTHEGVTFGLNDGNGGDGILFQVRCPPSSWSGKGEGQPRFERVG